VDLFVGSGLVPSAATVLCSSATSTAEERCDLRDPAPGDHWILLQSWQQSGTPPDRITMSHAVVGGASGTLAVSGPSASAECTQVDLEIAWHVPDPRDGERWYGAYSAGPDAGDPAGFGTAAIDLVFEDVTHWLFCVAPDAAIPDEGFLESTLSVPTGLFLTDVDVHLDVAHTFVGDLTVVLEKVGGPVATLVDRPGVPALSQFGCGGDDIDVVVDDDGPDGSVEDQCDDAPAIHGRRRGGDPPASVLASYFSEDLGGDWRLTVFDNAQFDTGTLREW
jgi:hypothetical protein